VKRLLLFCLIYVIMMGSGCSIYRDLGTIRTSYTDPQGQIHEVVSTHRCIVEVTGNDTTIKIEYEESSVWMSVLAWGGGVLSAIIAASVL
jgi:hypothetical protein